MRIVSKEKKREYNARYRSKNPRSRWANHIWEKYKLKLDDYDTMVKAQDDKCYCCGEELKLCIDHDHETGKVRKLICRTCNLIAGAIEHSKYEFVVKYLKEHGRKDQCSK